MSRYLPALLLAFLFVSARPGLAWQEDDGIERTGPTPRDTFETDANGDDVPDGWYNLRDVKRVDGGPSGRGKCFRFEADKPGRPARASRAFGVDGRKTEALIVGFWAKLEKPGIGDRLGDEPGLVIDFLGDQLRATRRGSIGPLTRTVGPRWTHVSKRLPVPPGTRDAILSVGLLGGTGIFEVDDLTIELVPVGGSSTSNLIVNGGFELGDPAPENWTAESGARRVSPGYQSSSCMELTKAPSRIMANVGLSVGRFPALEISAVTRAKDLRGVESVTAYVFFLDEDGRTVPGLGGGVQAFRWTGSFDWQPQKVLLDVPAGANHAVLQIDKTSPLGSFWIDQVAVRVSGDTRAVTWTPYHEATEVTGWLPVEASASIVKGSALDFSGMIEAPAGEHGFVGVKDGRLHFAKGGRPRFFGVAYLPPLAFLEPERTEVLVDRLVRSGINLVRLGDLDAPLGPSRSLIDDAREDTKELDAESLARFDHLISVFKKRGIYVALEFQSLRRYRPDDEVKDAELLPAGGGPAAAFDPTMRKLELEFATKLLTHVNPETGLALKDDPVLAWIALAGDTSVFDLIEDPSLLPPRYVAALKAKGTGRAAWRAAEAHQWKTLAEDLRKVGVKVPIAGGSHWRREPEYSAAQASPGLNLIDDRLYWNPPSHGDPDRRSMLWARDGGIRAAAGLKRKSGLGYVVGQFCGQTRAWALPYEAGDLIYAVSTAVTDDWDGLSRRGIFLNPENWGAAAPGTSGGEDLFAIPAAVNANPQVFALLPHAASLMHRDRDEKGKNARTKSPVRAGESKRGRLVIETPHVQGIVGWFDGANVPLDHVLIDADSKYGALMVSSIGGEPIATSSRILVTAVARVEPTGLRFVDEWRREVADPGTAPLLAEPVKANVVWRTKKKVKAYALDNTGARVREVPLKATADGPQLVIDGATAGFHWELTAD